MKILDKYIAKNFLFGYMISFAVLMGLRIVLDLFINLDEFAEHSDLGGAAVLMNIARYYGFQSALYFRDFAGMITVNAAVFSLWKITRNNELIAVMASGVSLKRVLAPIVVLAIALTSLYVVDQELIIPSIGSKLMRTHDELPGQEKYPITYIEDENNTLISSANFEEQNAEMTQPVLVFRSPAQAKARFQIDGVVWADSAEYNSDLGGWNLENGRYFSIQRTRSDEINLYKPQPIEFYSSDLTPEQIPQRRKQAYLSILSSAQLAELARQKSRIKDLAQLYSQKHFRITDPAINLVMLLLALPLLVCRDPKQMKTAVMYSFAMTFACFVVAAVCKMLATEVFFQHVWPELWAWAPVIIFFPIACLELESMRT